MTHKMIKNRALREGKRRGDDKLDCGGERGRHVTKKNTNGGEPGMQGNKRGGERKTSSSTEKSV